MCDNMINENMYTKTCRQKSGKKVVRRPRDANQLAKFIVDVATSE